MSESTVYLTVSTTRKPRRKSGELSLIEGLMMGSPPNVHCQGFQPPGFLSEKRKASWEVCMGGNPEEPSLKACSARASRVSPSRDP